MLLGGQWPALNPSTSPETALPFPSKQCSLTFSSLSAHFDLSLEPVHCSRRDNTEQPRVELSSTDASLLKGSSSNVPHLYAASPHSFSSFDSTSVATSRRASSGSAPANSSGSSRVSCSTTSSSASTLEPPGNGSSADLRRIRPSQRRAFLEAAATTEPSTFSVPSIEEIERVNRYHTDSQINPEAGTPMHPIGNLDTLHRMLQSVSKSWSVSNASSSTTGTRSERRLGAKSSELPSRVITPVPSNSKALQPRGSRKAPSSLRNCTVPQQATSVRPAVLPSRSIPPHIQTAVAGMEATENPLKEAVAKLEGPVLNHPRKSIGNNSMPPPPPPLDPPPSIQQPHCGTTSVCDLSAFDMSVELAVPGPQMGNPVDYSSRPVKEGDLKDAEDSYDDLSFVDVDGLMDVDLDEQSSSLGQDVLHESKKVPRSQPASSGQTQGRSVASAVQDPKPLIKQETFSSMFSAPTQVAPFAPSVFAPKALGMRRVHSGPISGYKTSIASASASVSGAKPGTAPPCGHSSTRGPKPFKVPWARNDTSVATLEPSVVPEVRKPVPKPKRRGVMDLDSSFSFDDMDPEEVEQLLSQIGA
jgi:hypothetical protein